MPHAPSATMCEPHTSRSRPIASDPRPIPLLPHATPAHAYLIVAGIVLGVLAGPGVLGRLAPDVHRQLFGGLDAQQVEQLDGLLEAHRSKTLEQIQRLEGTGVSQDRVTERLDEFAAEEELIRAQIARQQVQARTDGVMPMLMAVMLAVVAVVLLEAVLGPQVDAQGRAVVLPVHGRLVTVRYGLLAVWTMLVLAQPAAMLSLKPVFAIALIAVALAVGLVPLGRNAPETT